jgi:hypothetical protein
MEISEQELRTMIRGAIARHRRDGAAAEAAQVTLDCRSHASHRLLALVAEGDECIIEPSVRCNHCGYCKSYGH